MKTEEFIQYAENFTAKMLDVLKAKNSDYSGNKGIENFFKNFESVEDRGICTTEQGLLVRINDKFNRVTSLLEKGSSEVKDESIEDTLHDMANYVMILAGKIKSKQNIMNDYQDRNQG